MFCVQVFFATMQQIYTTLLDQLYIEFHGDYMLFWGGTTNNKNNLYF